MLTEMGYEARRGQQFKGTPDSPDVECGELPFHWEVKRVERLNITKAYEQASKESGGEIAAVAHRRNGKPWLVTVSLEDFLTLFAEKEQCKENDNEDK